MKRIKVIITLFFFSLAFSGESQSLIEQGWQQLIQDNDTAAISFFNKALNQAIDTKDEATQANAFLSIAIASYGSSLHNGYHYATEALEKFDAQKNTIGRARCLQLIATIKMREGDITSAEKLAREAVSFFTEGKDSTLTKGLCYQLLGSIFEKKGKVDSSDYFYNEAYLFRKQNKDTIYLGSSLIQQGKIAARKNNMALAEQCFTEGFVFAQQRKNKQALVNNLLAQHSFYFQSLKNETLALEKLHEAIAIAENLSDKSFLTRCLQAKKEFLVSKKNYEEAYKLNEEILNLKEKERNYNEERLTQNLETQFEVKETERKLQLIQKEHSISKLTNYLLVLIILSVGGLALFGFFFYKKTHAQQKKLIETQQELLRATEEQKKLNEQQLKNEIEFKESQLSAITIHMLQKNNLLEEIQEKLNQKDTDLNAGISKVIHKNKVQEQEWDDFNLSFERVNKNFYQRIKQQYPDITQNELKICALIKMNLSMKEMAGILNISPDSVKTARYRLRKKLQLQTEDNLTEFIVNL